MPFLRETVRHPFSLRRASVTAARTVVPSIVRITLAGPELAGFASLGPTDHVKLFLPDPATGVLTMPEATEDGMRRPAGAGPIISRDYTPLGVHVAPDGGTTLDLDFVLHGDEGPASAWAAQAAAGQELGIGGPRGSRLAPVGIGRLLVVADETALPATRRWLGLIPASVPVTALFDVADETVAGYFEGADARVDAEWLYREDDAGQLEEALRSLGPIDDDTYVFMAGEATTLIPLRRYLRRELGLPADQVAASGYWKRGIVNLDHHAPLDPGDPD
ncbi:MAG TPA: siderophore-interacting protein [Pseudolysinimonas sp.]|nr:siderophore-interacting protein [Pseudolysinimonas sp.]